VADHYSSLRRTSNRLLPDEGTNNIAFGLISFVTLADYEQYRIRLKQDTAGAANFEFAQRDRFTLCGAANFEFAQRDRFTLCEERIFLRQVVIQQSDAS
jgi:hypothetical protein